MLPESDSSVLRDSPAGSGVCGERMRPQGLGARRAGGSRQVMQGGRKIISSIRIMSGVEVRHRNLGGAGFLGEEEAARRPGGGTVALVTGHI